MDRITIKYPGVQFDGWQRGHKVKEVSSIEVRSLADVSDGYHTIAELYDHRIELWITVCRFISNMEEDYDSKTGKRVWRSEFYSDGKTMVGWFLLGIGREGGKQMTYHLPMSRWNDTEFAEILDRGPEWDGHTSADVLERLKTL